MNTNSLRPVAHCRRRHHRDQCSDGHVDASEVARRCACVGHLSAESARNMSQIRRPMGKSPGPLKTSTTQIHKKRRFRVTVRTGGPKETLTERLWMQMRAPVRPQRACNAKKRRRRAPKNAEADGARGHRPRPPRPATAADPPPGRPATRPATRTTGVIALSSRSPGPRERW